MRLKKAIIPYLVLFESSQLLIFPISVGLRAVAESQVSSGGRRGQPSQEWPFQTLLLCDKGLEHRQRPHACIPTNPRFLMLLHFRNNWGHVLPEPL